LELQLAVAESIIVWGKLGFIVTILVSACLLGISCRYDATHVHNPKVERWLKDHSIVPVCPEQLGGLATPRSPAEIEGAGGTAVLDGEARVYTRNRREVTCEYVSGAQAALRIARLVGARKALLKARSPSCGCRQIYDGTHSGVLKQGQGVTAALLQRNNVEVFTEEDI
jgi:uncharacterized protein YbbK (DUF523 family)